MKHTFETRKYTNKEVYDCTTCGRRYAELNDTECVIDGQTWRRLSVRKKQKIYNIKFNGGFLAEPVKLKSYDI